MRSALMKCGVRQRITNGSRNSPAFRLYVQLNSPFAVEHSREEGEKKQPQTGEHRDVEQARLKGVSPPSQPHSTLSSPI